jgi:hypothetical protein
VSRSEPGSRRSLSALSLLGALAVVLACVPGARAQSGAAWRLAPALAPPPPPGVAPAPYSVPVGEVGEISFWAANRGLLITGGHGPVPAGLYAYDGVDWHELANVCGGAEGRIAWAGPDDFWTISDQRGGQITRFELSGNQLQSISLCHFVDGQVVGSYAMPLEEPESYVKMDAAACYGPSDCWFGGQDGIPPNFGAFHLHWDGVTVSTVYEPEDHAVTDMVNLSGQLYESVQIEPTDAWLPEESTDRPAVLHTIAPEGLEPIFGEYQIFAGRHLPVYGEKEKVHPDALQGLSLATDGNPLGLDSTQLWAAADPTPGPPSGSDPASVTVLRYADEKWSQLTPTPDGESLLGTAKLAGTEYTEVGNVIDERGAGGTIAPEPGSTSAWLSLQGGGDDAEVARLEAVVPEHAGEAEAKLVETDRLPELDESVGPRGEAGPIACPAAQDCWMVTTQGWLFHYSNGAPVSPDTDPFFDGEDGVLAYRPSDSGVPTIYPDVPPIDDSLANQVPPAPNRAPEQTPAKAVKGHRKKAKPLVEHVKSKLLHRRVLVLSFTLTAHAHVQLIARRSHRIVASTRRESLSRGSHSLALSLNPAHWPTGLQFKATPVGKGGEGQGGSDGSSEGSGANTITTG